MLLMDRFDCQVCLLVAVALASPLLLRVCKVKKLWAALLLTACLCCCFFFSVVQQQLARSTSHEVYGKLGLKRAFLSSEIKGLKRSLLSRYHPDRAASDSEREELLNRSKEVSRLLDMVADPLRREALDRFNWTFRAESVDKE